MVARVISKNVDWIAFETSDDCGNLEIIDYDHVDIDIGNTMEGNFKSSQYLCVNGSSVVSVGKRSHSS